MAVDAWEALLSDISAICTRMDNLPQRVAFPCAFSTGWPVQRVTVVR